MTPPNRQAAAKARATVNTWLRQKYKKVKPRGGRRLTGHSHALRQQTAVASGGTIAADKLRSFRLWMYDAGMMASKQEEYRQKMAEACRQFDDYLAQNSARAKGRRSGRGGGKTITVGRTKVA